MAFIPAIVAAGASIASAASAAAPVLGTIGTIAGAAGTVMSGVAAGKAADYQAKVAENNAKTAEQNAAYSAHAGVTQAENASKREAAKGAAIKAAMAANGVDVNTGSDLDVTQSQRQEGLLNTQNVEQNALLQVYGYRTQATNYQAQAELDKQTAHDAPIGAAFGAAGSLLSNAKATGFGGGGLGGGGTVAGAPTVAAAQTGNDMILNTTYTGPAGIGSR